MSEAYRAAGTERAHGAGSPGLGFDAPYGVAHAVRRINQWLENRGVEQWVRNLRDNAEPGVEYLWTTRTKKSGQTLANREYTISAVVDGQIIELYVFETSVPAGSPPGDANVQFDADRSLAGRGGVRRAADQGEPGRAGGRGGVGTDRARPPIERVEPPEVLVDALGRTRRTTPELAHPCGGPDRSSGSRP